MRKRERERERELSLPQGWFRRKDAQVTREHHQMNTNKNERDGREREIKRERERGTDVFFN